MPATGAFSGTPALSRLIVLAQTEPIEVEPLELQRLADLADGVRELLARRQHRQQRPLGERAVADLAALRRAHAAGLTGRVRREVVVVHVALAVVRVERVDHLLHAQHGQRGDAQDLGLATLEQRRTVDPREHVDLGGERADVGEPTTVDTHLVADDPLADQRLGQRPERGADLLLAALELSGDALFGQRRGRGRARPRARSCRRSAAQQPARSLTAAVRAASRSWP